MLVSFDCDDSEKKKMHSVEYKKKTTVKTMNEAFEMSFICFRL